MNMSYKLYFYYIKYQVTYKIYISIFILSTNSLKQWRRKMNEWKMKYITICRVMRIFGLNSLIATMLLKWRCNLDASPISGQEDRSIGSRKQGTKRDQFVFSSGIQFGFMHSYNWPDGFEFYFGDTKILWYPLPRVIPRLFLTSRSF